jgi:hypothetical protein
METRVCFSEQQVTCLLLITSADHDEPVLAGEDLIWDDRGVGSPVARGFFPRDQVVGGDVRQTCDLLPQGTHWSVTIEQAHMTKPSNVIGDDGRVQLHMNWEKIVLAWDSNRFRSIHTPFPVC